MYIYLRIIKLNIWERERERGEMISFQPNNDRFFASNSLGLEEDTHKRRKVKMRRKSKTRSSIVLQYAAKMDSKKASSKWRSTLVAHDKIALKEKKERDDHLNTLTRQLQVERKRERREKMHIEKL